MQRVSAMSAILHASSNPPTSYQSEGLTSSAPFSPCSGDDHRAILGYVYFSPETSTVGVLRQLVNGRPSSDAYRPRRWRERNLPGKMELPHRYPHGRSRLAAVLPSQSSHRSWKGCRRFSGSSAGTEALQAQARRRRIRAHRPRSGSCGCCYGGALPDLARGSSKAEEGADPAGLDSPLSIPRVAEIRGRRSS